MATSKSLIHRGLNGSLGGLTFCTQKDRVIVKECVKEVRNPNTEKQQIQRQALSKTIIAWQMIGSKVKSGITKMNKYGNPYSTFVSNNLNFNKTTKINKEAFENEMLTGITTTIGSLNPLKVNSIIGTEQILTVKVDFSDLTGSIKQDDRICILYGIKNSKGFTKKEILIKDFQGNLNEKSVTFKHNMSEPMVKGIIAIWYEDAKGVKSSTSNLVVY